MCKAQTTETFIYNQLYTNSINPTKIGDFWGVQKLYKFLTFNKN